MVDIIARLSPEFGGWFWASQAAGVRSAIRSWGRQLDRMPRSPHSGVCLRSCPGTVWDLPVPGPSENRTLLLQPAGCIARDKLGDFCLALFRIELPPLGKILPIDHATTLLLNLMPQVALQISLSSSLKNTTAHVRK
jgi:hypothetical protein